MGAFVSISKMALNQTVHKSEDESQLPELQTAAGEELCAAPCTKRCNVSFNQGAPGEGDANPLRKRKKGRGKRKKGLVLDSTKLHTLRTDNIVLRCLSPCVACSITYLAENINKRTFDLSYVRLEGITLKDIDVLVCGLGNDDGKPLPPKIATAAIFYLRIVRTMSRANKLPVLETEIVETTVSKLWSAPLINDLILFHLQTGSACVFTALTFNLYMAMNIVFPGSMLSDDWGTFEESDFKNESPGNTENHFEKHKNFLYRQIFRKMHLMEFSNFMQTEDQMLPSEIVNFLGMVALLERAW